jgi:hypothetical protein
VQFFMLRTRPQMCQGVLTQSSGIEDCGGMGKRESN